MRHEAPVVIQETCHDSYLVDVGGRFHGFDSRDLGFLRGEAIPRDLKSQKVDCIASDDRFARVKTQSACAAHVQDSADVLGVVWGGVGKHTEVVLVCNAEVVEPVFGDLGIHDALKDFGAVDSALRQAIVAPELAFPPELEDVPSVWIERNLIIS